METKDFTEWNPVTREIYVDGVAKYNPETEERTPLITGNLTYWGGAYKPATHIFDDDGKPKPRETSPERSQDELRIEINRERARRSQLGFDYDFGDARGVHRIGTTDEDMKGWNRVTALKDILFQIGDTTTAIGISTDTGLADVTGPEWNAILMHAAINLEQPLWAASFALHAMDPIPQDIENDTYWPAPA